jgi:alpha-glucosidase
MPMRTGRLAFVCLTLAVAQAGFAQTAPSSQTAPASPTSVDAMMITTHTLCLRVRFTTDPLKQSMFLVPLPKQPSPEAVREGAFRGEKNAAGTLLVDRDAGRWTLKDARGVTVIHPTAFPTLTTNPRTNQPQITCPITPPPPPPNTGPYDPLAIAIYGSGDMTGGIAQTRGQSRVGNGITNVPFYWTTAGYSVFVLGDDDNAPASWQRAADGTVSWTIPGKTVDLYLTPTSKLQEATEAYAELTGRPPIPPRWTFGYMQSRWGWTDKAYIDDTLKQFLDRKLPVDAFIFDFEWYTAQPDYQVPAAGTPDYSDFSWNPALFPDPAKQIADMHAKGVHFVGIRKPRLGNADALTQIRAKGWIAPPPTSASRGVGGLTGATEQRLLDYAKPEVRDWYAQQMVPLLKAGIEGWWNDEGEQTFTTYMNWNQSEVDALKLVNPKARFWSINRAFQPGMQRLGAAAWTGDIGSNWNALADTPTRLLNWSLAGMYYGSCDIGGFMGNINAELLTRWMQAGVFFPVMRSHSSNRVTPRFPWLYGEQAEANIRKALELRYRLIPYYYSLANQAATRGTPLMRPLVMAFPDDRQVANLTNQWLMGDSLMAAPVLTQATQRSVYFPKATTWFTFDTNKIRTSGASADIAAGYDQIPVFVRAGTILPLAPAIQHTDDLPGGPLDLQIYPGADASFVLWEDDGLIAAASDDRATTFTWDDAKRTLSWKVEGSYRGKDIFKEMKVTVFDPKGVVTRNSPLQASGSMTLGN